MKPKPSGAFLTRLAQDTCGSTLAIMAAAIVPLIGLIGGGLDMSRIYLTKTRVQQACDAGALAGRKAMGADSWTTSGATSSRGRAYEMFDANFKTGDYGTGNRTREFTELDGTVNGVATAVVPMTLMKVFGKADYTVSVDCTAKMEIPNTDVMFVLDVTASMGCAPNDGSCGYDLTPPSDSKIYGLKSAVKCFYEALLKVNTAEPCSTSPAVDPTATSYTGTAHIRLGFVPYAANVNVGKLLPHSFMADSWAYQSREPVYDAGSINGNSLWAWSLGSESSITGWGSWGSWSITLANLDSSSTYTTTSWSDIGSSGSETVPATAPGDNAGTYARRRDLGQTACEDLNTLKPDTTNQMLAYSDAAVNVTQSLVSTSPSPPVHPATQQTLNYSQTDNHTATGYRYRYYSSSSGSARCRLQRATRNYSRDRTNGTSTKPITWTEINNRVLSWTYKEVTHDVSGLKGGSGTPPVWNGTVALPLALTAPQTVTLSGQSGTSTIYQLATTPVTWDGCIEERRPTYQGVDNDPSNDYSPIPAIAKDLDINLVPTSAADTKWGPLLRDAFWGRYTGSAANRTTTKTINDVIVPAGSADLDRNIASGVITGYDCISQARKLQEYTTPASLESYIGGPGTGLLATGMGTYHDIGLLWGARLLSPTGIFASENALTPQGGAIERHLIFMTDGNAQTFNNNLTAYGSSWWDRRLSNYVPANGNSTQETELQTRLTNTVNARLSAICTQIKNMQITLWVVYYGGDSSAANETRLTNCATPGHFYTATDTAALKTKFKQIAADISDLRLTQ